MPELRFLAELHFLRPFWLWGLVPALALYALARWRDDPTRRWRSLIDPHLLEALRVKPKGRALLGPADLAVLALVLCCLGAAGPAWEREPSPFTEDKAPLVVALDLSESMLAIDVPPTRLDRAREKIRDLLVRREGARTGLVVYAGTAHLVLPPTDDVSALETYLAALDPSLMPREGKAAAAALARAQQVLDGDATPGSILFVTDGIPVDEREAFRAHAASRKEGLLVLGLGTSEGGPIRRGRGFATDGTGRPLTARLDREGLEALGRETGAFVATATLDDRDVDRLQAHIQRHLEAVRQAESSARWKDAGVWLTIPVALLGALWFRKGWTLGWTAALLVGLCAGTAPSAPAQPAPAAPVRRPPAEEGWRQAAGHPWRFADLWLTPDQQGRLAWERGGYAAAAALFEDPMWRGVAACRAGDWDAAVDAFAQLQSPDGFFNLGNAYARRGDLPLAVEAYERALALRPGWREAREDRDRVAALIPKRKKQSEDEEGRADPNQPPDQVKFDDRGKKGRAGRIEVSRAQMGEVWLRSLTTSPAGFLRQKFAAQAAAAGERR
jgi:Ca-activated chloride channel family protein